MILEDGKISVILTVYNREEKYLREAINAVLNQSLKEFEFHIINNGSTDPMCDKVIREFDDDRIVYHKWETNFSMKNGVEFYKKIFQYGMSEYVIWTHDDDMMEKDLLLKEKQVLDKDNTIAMVSSNLRYIDEKGNDRNHPSSNIDSDVVYKQYEYITEVCLGKAKIICCPTILYRRKYFQKAISRIEEAGCGSGLANDGLLRLCINTFPCKLVILNERLFKYRCHSQSNSCTSRFGYSESRYKNNSVFLKPYYESGNIEGYNFYCEQIELAYNRVVIEKRIIEQISSEVGTDVTDIVEILEKNKVLNEYMKEDINRYSTFLIIKYIKETVKKKEYILWGTGSASSRIKLLMDYFIPSMSCAGYIDSFQEGYKEGYKIWKSDKYNYDTEKYIIVAATTAEKEICDFLNGKRMNELEDYMPQFIY